VQTPVYSKLATFVSNLDSVNRFLEGLGLRVGAAPRLTVFKRQPRMGTVAVKCGGFGEQLLFSRSATTGGPAQ